MLLPMPASLLEVDSSFILCAIDLLLLVLLLSNRCRKDKEEEDARHRAVLAIGVLLSCRRCDVSVSGIER